MTNVTEVIPASQYAAELKKSQSALLEDTFDAHCRFYKLPPFERKFRFAKSIGRQWEFDFAWPLHRVAVEVEGLIVRKLFDKEGKDHTVCMGRHASITGFREDCEKYANAALLGWFVLRWERDQVKKKFAVDFTQRVLAMYPPKMIYKPSLRENEPLPFTSADPF